MSRRVIAASASTLGGAWSTELPRPDGYLARLIKYTPVEAVAVYVAASGVTPEDRPGFRAIVSLLCLFAIPFYLRWATHRDDLSSPRMQIAFATLAFPCWVLALGGPFAELGWHEDVRGTASVLLAVVTLGFPLFAPAPGE
jgi:hypothetical protein